MCVSPLSMEMISGVHGDGLYDLLKSKHLYIYLM